MKRFAIVSVVLLLIALLGVGAMYMTSNVTVIARALRRWKPTGTTTCSLT